MPTTKEEPCLSKFPVCMFFSQFLPEQKRKKNINVLYVNVCKSNPVLSSAETKTHIV